MGWVLENWFPTVSGLIWKKLFISSQRWVLQGRGNMAERKVVGRKVAIILGAVCIALAAGMIVTLFAYLPLAGQADSLKAQVTEKDQSIAALTSQVSSLNAQISSLSGGANSSSNVIYLQNMVNDLQGEITRLQNVLYMNASATLIPSQGFQLDANSNMTIWDQPDTPLFYAGFVTVSVTSSSNSTFVELAYSSYGLVYDNVVTVGTGGTAYFPVLPGAIVITLGSFEANSTVTGTAVVTYIY
jgi:cell division protein FtsB